MNRLQQKCLAGSAAFHGLLLALLLVGPAFVPSKPKAPELPPLEVLPSDFLLTDQPFSGGGSRTATPPPQPQPQPQPQPAPQPQPQPTPPQPQPEPRTPPKAAPEAAPEPEPVTKGDIAVPDPPKTKSKIKVNTEIVKRGGETTPAKPSKEEIAKEQERQERAAADQRRAVARRLQAKTRSLVNTLGDSLSSSTAVEMPGPGGMAYINYRQFVKTEYEDAWIPPESVVDESATVRASVTIRRDGTVLDDKIVGPSGIPGLDKSVEAALDRVRLKGLRPFPEGARDAQRVFTIVFNLKSKRNTG